MKESLNILFLSSRMPSHSANLGKDVITSLTKAGHHVQFGFDGIEEYIEKQTRTKKNTVVKKAYYKLHYYLRKYLNGLVDYLPTLDTWARDGKVLFHPYENRPPFPVKTVLDNLHGDYDICYVLFTHQMFTMKTLKAIYDKFHCPIVMCAVDMMSMTGGCYYFGDCRNFETECGNCPVCGGRYKNDQTHKNFLYKKSVYDNIECVLFCNSWQLEFARKSHLFDNAKMQVVSVPIDENEYAPRNIRACRKKFNIPDNKKYIFLSRYRNIARKGMNVLTEGINRLYDSLAPDKREQTLLVLIGEKNDQVDSIFKMAVLQLGFLKTQELIEAYNASTAFLCTSIDDAGPSMINQSMACGTPVIAFDAGCAPDMIDDGVNGFKAPLSEKEKWGDGLLKICAMDDEEYEEMRRQARKKTVGINGLKVFSNAIEEVYHEFRPNGKK